MINGLDINPFYQEQAQYGKLIDPAHPEWPTPIEWTGTMPIGAFAPSA